MRIVARIVKLGEDQYLFDGKVFDSFVNARRVMVERTRLRRTERRSRTVR